jgi:hypothetical protein
LVNYNPSQFTNPKEQCKNLLLGKINVTNETKIVTKIELHQLYKKRLIDFWCLMPLSNISAISWRPALVVEEAGVSGENHRLWASNW